MTFDEFVAENTRSLLRSAWVMTSDWTEAEDLVQEALLRTHQRWSRVKDVERPAAYVHRILTNLYISGRRRIRPALAAMTERHDRDLQGCTQSFEERDAMTKALRGLPRQQRTVLGLRYYEGLSDDEIAELLGCRPGTVRGYASRGLDSLRRTLTQDLQVGIPDRVDHEG